MQRKKAEKDYRGSDTILTTKAHVLRTRPPKDREG